MKRPLSSQKPRRKAPIVATLVVALVVLLGAGAFWALRHNTAKNAANTIPSEQTTASQDTKGETGTSQPEETSQNEPGDDKSNSGGQAADPSTPLQDITGTFVSNHHASLTASNTMQSTCSTTAGASCIITFTKDGVSKSLESQVTDRGGTAYWSWKLQDAGLTEGSWKVTVKATLGTQTKTASDAINLEVTQ